MLTDKVKKTIKRYGLTRRGERILIGVSGGADSVALLYALKALQPELKLSLHAAHLDHMLRKDSGEDLEFVRSLCEKLKVPVTCARINVAALSKTGSVEEIARRARLGFFLRVAKEVKAKRLALGHNFDDQAETVLMRILRGSGLYGLSGILPKREIFKLSVIRPLIECRRKEIEAFLRKKKVKFRTDKTNLVDIYFRNKIRNSLIPLLEQSYNRKIKDVLGNMASCIAFDYEYLKLAASRVRKGWGGNMRVDKLLKAHPSLRRLILRAEVSRLAGDTRRLAFRHIKEIEELLASRPSGSIVDLPKNISFAKKGNTLLVYRRKH